MMANDNRKREYKLLRGGSGGGGSGGGDCDACCESVPVGNMLHEDLPAGYDETTRDWRFRSGCGTAIEPIEIPNDDRSLVLVWPGGIPVGTYEDTGRTFVKDITSECTMLDGDGEDVTSETDFEATFVMNFVSRDIVIGWEETA